MMSLRFARDQQPLCSCFKKQAPQALQKQSELVRIAETWFPRSLLIDISKGHLNLAEAILDAHEGGPWELNH